MLKRTYEEEEVWRETSYGKGLTESGYVLSISRCRGSQSSGPASGHKPIG